MLKLVLAKRFNSFWNYIWWPISKKLKTPSHWSLVTGHWSLKSYQLSTVNCFFSIKILNQRKKSAHRGADPLRGAQARKRFQNLRKNFDTENETALPQWGGKQGGRQGGWGG